jgi:hypothetical protein
MYYKKYVNIYSNFNKRYLFYIYLCANRVNSKFDLQRLSAVVGRCSLQEVAVYQYVTSIRAPSGCFRRGNSAQSAANSFTNEQIVHL